MAELPTHPVIWGDLSLHQLHITGASYTTKGDAPSVPVHIILGNKNRRWELVISDIYETDKQGKRLTPAPAEHTIELSEKLLAEVDKTYPERHWCMTCDHANCESCAPNPTGYVAAGGVSEEEGRE